MNDSTANIENPVTLDDWWNHVKTDCPIAKARYFLRNYGAMGCSLEAMIEFIGHRVPLVKHRGYGYEPCGNYSIEGEHRIIQFRIDPSTPGVYGPRHGVPSVCVCNDYFTTKGRT